MSVKFSLGSCFSKENPLIWIVLIVNVDVRLAFIALDEILSWIVFGVINYWEWYGSCLMYHSLLRCMLY